MARTTIHPMEQRIKLAEALHQNCKKARPGVPWYWYLWRAEKQGLCKPSFAGKFFRIKAFRNAT